MERFLERMLSLDNPTNKQFLTPLAVYKFYRLYENVSTLTDDERRTRPHVSRTDGEGFHVLNRFFVSLLEQHAIWFSPASAFNDPWDAGNAISKLSGDVALESAVLELLVGADESQSILSLPPDARRERIETALREALGILRFACFTTQLRSNPMWAHYADDHRGVCLQFAFTKRPPRPIPGVSYLIDREFHSCFPIRYSGDFARVPDAKDIFSTVQLLYTKHPDWAYEHEVRFIRFGDRDYPDQGGTIPFRKETLTKVILGCKVPQAVVNLVGWLLERLGYSQTKLVGAKFQHDTQSLSYYELRRTRESEVPRDSAGSST
jgi:hypothetical protein